MNAAAVAAMESMDGPAPMLTEVTANAQIKDLMAEVEITQRYRNTGAVNIEAVYTFPIPLDGVLLSLGVEIGDRKLVGTVIEKTEAEHRYEEAITDGDTAVLLEQAGPGLYTASLGNLLPGDEATIRFRYGLLLRWNGDRIRFMLPTTIAPRYGDPSTACILPHQDPEFSFDAERAFHLTVNVAGLLQGARFNSPSHAVAIETLPQQTVIEIAGKPAMDRDFVLEVRSSAVEADGALVSQDLDGWVALASFRPSLPQAANNENRSIKIVVDCSGSMMGDSIAQARVALERILDGLRDGDVFEIIAFGSTTRALFGQETLVSQASLTKARRFVRSLDSDMGGTEIGAGLEAAYSTRAQVAAGSRNLLSRDLLLITDGEVWDTETVLATARQSGHRIFTVGVGSAVAEAFVRGLAEATGGACELVAPREDMADRIYRHFQRMYAPRAKAQLSWPVSPARSVPSAIEHVHDGDTLHVFAWFPEKPQGRAALHIDLADGRTLTHEADILSYDGASAGEQAMPSTLARLAAARTFVGAEDSKAVETALRYQLMSEWTDYLVVHVRAEGELAEDLPVLHKVPQELAAGWHGLGSVFARARLAPVAECRMLKCDLDETSAERGRRMSTRGLLDERFFSFDGEELSPAELVEILNDWMPPPLPSLDDLEACGLPENILESLRDLVSQGDEEEAVVAAFLDLVAHSEAGRCLQRQVRRHIVKSFKSTKLPRPAVSAIRKVMELSESWRSVA